MHLSTLVLLVLALVVWSMNIHALPFTGTCDSCGKECFSACGTRGFRTCCLNYLKKRSTPLSTGSEMRLELMMVLPELAQYYPSLRNLIPNNLVENENLQIVVEKQGIDKIKYSGSE